MRGINDGRTFGTGLDSIICWRAFGHPYDNGSAMTVYFDRPTQRLLRSSFRYQNGQLHWRTRDRRRNPDVPAGAIHSTGHRRIMLQGKLYRAAALVWVWHHGKWPDDYLKHMDGDLANNAIENLEEGHDRGS